MSQGWNFGLNFSVEALHIVDDQGQREIPLREAERLRVRYYAYKAFRLIPHRH